MSHGYGGSARAKPSSREWILDPNVDQVVLGLRTFGSRAAHLGTESAGASRLVGTGNDRFLGLGVGCSGGTALITGTGTGPGQCVYLP